MINRLLISVTVAVLGCAFFTQSATASRDVPTCPETNSVERNACAGAVYRDLAKELAALEARYLEQLTVEEHRIKFRDAQEAWRHFAEADCEFRHGHFRGGSAWGYGNNMCMARHVVKRIEAVETYVECKQNGCPY